jgi:hypothetical protein
MVKSWWRELFSIETKPLNYMRKYNVYLIECGTLKKEYIVTLNGPESLDEARRYGETKYGKPNHFIGIEGKKA